MISDRKRHVLVLPIGFYVIISFVNLLIRRTQHIKFLGVFWMQNKPTTAQTVCKTKRNIHKLQINPVGA